MRHAHMFPHTAAVLVSNLAAGVYWQTGLVTAAPTSAGGWTAGLPGVAAADTITLLRVQAAAARTGAAYTLSWKGTMAVPAGKYWDGSAWQDLASLSAGTGGLHAAYSSEAASATFTSVSSTAFLFQFDATALDAVTGEAFTVS